MRLPGEITNKKYISIFREWQSDWNLFVRDVLKARLDKEQQAIISAVQHNRMVAVASGTSRGKDFVSACAALCFMYLTPSFDSNGKLIGNTKIALTAPTSRQVTNIMTPEVRRLFRQAEVLPGRLVADDIRTDYEEWFLTGFKAGDDNKEAWSGFHAVNTMFVITEASGISNTIFETIEGNLQGNSRLLLVFNPNVRIGYAARAMTSPRFKKFHLSSLNAENVVEKRMVIPGQVDYDWVSDKVSEWAVPIAEEEVRADQDDFEWEGRWYRPNDLFRVKVLGRFPKIEEDVLLPPQWLEEAMLRYEEFKASGQPFRSTEHRVLGVDVAGMGRDDTVKVDREGALVHSIERHNSAGQANHMKTAGELIQYRRTNPKAFVSIDTIGEGAGVYSAVLEAESASTQNKVISCKFSEGAKRGSHVYKDITGQYEFANMRAYLYWCLRDWLDPKNETRAMLPRDEHLIEEAAQVKWEFNSLGKIQIEAKEKIKERLGRSPDILDALVNTFYPVSHLHALDMDKLSRMIY